jgi:hypothetical protein
MRNIHDLDGVVSECRNEYALSLEVNRQVIDATLYVGKQNLFFQLKNRRGLRQAEGSRKQNAEKNDYSAQEHGGVPPEYRFRSSEFIADETGEQDEN